MRGIVGLLFEIAVLASLVAAVCCNAAVVGTCKFLTLGGGLGEIGPWRADIDGGGCVSWNKNDTDEDDWLTNMARACSVMGK